MLTDYIFNVLHMTTTNVFGMAGEVSVETLNGGGAVAALFGADRDGHQALRAIPGGWRGGGRGFQEPAVDHPQQEKNSKSDNHKIHNGIQEQTIVDGCRTVSLGVRNGCVMRLAQIDEQVGKIDAAERTANGRHDDIVHKRGNDFAESRSDDDTDSHIED